jgi:hypothetical protein
MRQPPSHILHREYPYVDAPKPDGYRCHHMVFRFQGTGDEAVFNERRIEIQIRTRLQLIQTFLEMFSCSRCSSSTSRRAKVRWNTQCHRAQPFQRNWKKKRTCRGLRGECAGNDFTGSCAALRRGSASRCAYRCVAAPHNADVFLCAFDLIELNGDDLRGDPLAARRATLVDVLARASPGLRFNEHLDEEDGPLVFHHACKLGLEGIVSKRKDSRYSSGRSPHWTKSKNPNAPAVRRERAVLAVKNATGKRHTYRQR